MDNKPEIDTELTECLSKVILYGKDELSGDYNKRLSDALDTGKITKMQIDKAKKLHRDYVNLIVIDDIIQSNPLYGKNSSKFYEIPKRVKIALKKGLCTEEDINAAKKLALLHISIEFITNLIETDTNYRLLLKNHTKFSNDPSQIPIRSVLDFEKMEYFLKNKAFTEEEINSALNLHDGKKIQPSIDGLFEKKPFLKYLFSPQEDHNCFDTSFTKSEYLNEARFKSIDYILLERVTQDVSALKALEIAYKDPQNLKKIDVNNLIRHKIITRNDIDLAEKYMRNKEKILSKSPTVFKTKDRSFLKY